MNLEESERLEQELRELGGRFPYPPTPDLARREMRRVSERRNPRRSLRLVLVTTLSMLALVALVAVVPVARAAALSWLRIGAITIFPVEPDATPLAPSGLASLPTPQGLPGLRLDELAGEIDAASSTPWTGMTWMLPTYPPGLGRPDRVFVQDFIEPTLISAWVDPADPDQARLILFQFGEGAVAKKLQPVVVTETVVAGQPAVWLEGPHMLFTQNGDTVFERLVAGHVLIWTVGEYTFRLETTQTLDEARRTAESLRTVNDEFTR